MNFVLHLAEGPFLVYTDVQQMLYFWTGYDLYGLNQPLETVLVVLRVDPRTLRGRQGSSTEFLLRALKFPRYRLVRYFANVVSVNGSDAATYLG